MTTFDGSALRSTFVRRARTGRSRRRLVELKSFFYDHEGAERYGAENPSVFGRPTPWRLMPTPIDREEVQRLVAAGARLVEVLPRADFEEAHLPGAINIPLKELDRGTTEQLERSGPVIVYCHDSQ